MCWKGWGIAKLETVEREYHGYMHQGLVFSVFGGVMAIGWDMVRNWETHS